MPLLARHWGVDPRFGHQGRQAGNEFQWLEGHVRGFVPGRRRESLRGAATRREYDYLPDTASWLTYPPPRSVFVAGFMWVIYDTINSVSHMEETRAGKGDDPLALVAILQTRPIPAEVERNPRLAG